MGTYQQVGEHHGRPIFRKPPGPQGPPTGVLIYFWDASTGENYSGWWLGPRIGGDQSWAFNPNRASPTPPTTGWHIPWDGPVDQHMRLHVQGAGGEKRPHGDSEAWARDASPKHPREGRAMGAAPHSNGWSEGPSAIGAGGHRLSGWDKAPGAAAAAQAQPRGSAGGSWPASPPGGGGPPPPPAARPMTPQEQAALEIRRAIQGLSSATPEDFDLHSAQLDEVLEEHKEALGAHVQRMELEVRDALRQARQRLHLAAVDSVRQAARRLCNATAETFEALRQELMERQSRMQEWLGNQAEALAVEVREALRVSQIRIEQMAVQAIRVVMQRIAACPPEGAEALTAELQRACLENLPRVGHEREQVQVEMGQAMAQLQVLTQQARQLQAARRQEAERLGLMVAEVGAQVLQLEAEAERSAAAVARVAGDEEPASPEESLQAAREAEEAIAGVQRAAQGALEACARAALEVAASGLQPVLPPPPPDMAGSLADPAAGAGPGDVPSPSLEQCRARLLALVAAGADAAERARTTRERAARMAAAARKEREQRELFAKYDLDGDQQLGQSEIEALARGEYELELQGDFLEKVRLALGGTSVPYDKFGRLRQMLAIELSEVRARAAKAAEEERLRREQEERERREREIAERTAAARTLLAEAGSQLPKASSALASIEVESAALLIEEKLSKLSSAELIESADKAESSIAPPSSTLVGVRGKLEEAERVLGQELIRLLDTEVSDLRVRLERAEARAARLRLAAGKARERSAQAAEREARLNKQREAVAKLESRYADELDEDDGSEEWAS